MPFMTNFLCLLDLCKFLRIDFQNFRYRFLRINQNIDLILIKFLAMSNDQANNSSKFKKFKTISSKMTTTPTEFLLSTIQSKTGSNNTGSIGEDFSRMSTNQPKSLFEQRPRLSNAFRSIDPKSEISHQPIWDDCVSSMNFNDQQDLLVDDLLYCMQGIEGDHVRIIRQSQISSNDSIDLRINPHFDESLRELANRIAGVCRDYHRVVRFVDEVIDSSTTIETSGVVIQTLASAIRTILDEYDMYVVQMETCQMGGGTDGLSLQSMWYHIQSVQRTLNCLADACGVIEISKIYGGALLTYMHSKREEFAGDTKVREMFAFLLLAVSKPYFYQLERWMYHGELVNKKNEFLIVQNVDEKQRQASGAIFDEVDDWERRYSIRKTMCPSFLVPVAEKILNSGKYVNIISSCGRHMDAQSSSDPKQPQQQLRYNPDDRQYLRIIEDAYAYAGQALVSLLLDEYSLMDRLQSLKHYFLLDRGDWLLHFMENAEPDLGGVIADLIPHRIASLLGLAFNSSSVAHDPLRSSIGYEFHKQNLPSSVLEIVRIKGGAEFKPRRLELDTRRAFGSDAFAITYNADWPLSIVLNKVTLLKYQVMFRQLFTFKNMEWQLSRAWRSRRNKTAQAVLLHKLMTFVRKFLYHASVDVIEPYWQRFVETVAKQRASRTTSGDRNSLFTIDDLLREHKFFVDKCMADMLLTEETLINCTEKICEMCKEAAEYLAVDRTDHPGGGASGGGELDVDFMEQEYASTVEDLLTHMRSLSSSTRDKGWMDVAYSLGLIKVH